MFDFNESIINNAAGKTLICAHRGVSGGNIPCNTLAAFSAALMQGADMIELDVTKSRDGRFFVFHPGKERAHLGKHRVISAMRGDCVKKLRFINIDNDKTQFCVNELCEVLDYLRGKCYINVDKFWTDIPGISKEIRRAGVEKQVVVKTELKDKYLKPLKECAADMMFMPVIDNEDNVTDMLKSTGINCIGAEVLFENENAPVASYEYISSMHKKGMLLFVNAEVFYYKTVLSAGHNDDVSVTDDPEKGWGWLIDRGFDIIQTDWCGALKIFTENRKKQ
ncbi:MAG: glycerophosphodiester phosphodiesterase family protein [Oscillospiraceae bacterium]|nr:glycerophosphodiester phosphodiesterase family protein [Oscillospiraceae bacterium]